MFFKKKKKIIEEKKEVTYRHNFKIPQIKEEKNIRKTFKRTDFVSPIFGNNVKNDTIIEMYNKKQDVVKTYDAFRDVKKQDTNKLKEKNGTKYHEFNLISSKNSNEIFGRDTKKYVNNKKDDLIKKEKESKLVVPFGMKSEIEIDFLTEITKDIKKEETPLFNLEFEDEEINNETEFNIEHIDNEEEMLTEFNLSKNISSNIDEFEIEEDIQENNIDEFIFEVEENTDIENLEIQDLEDKEYIEDETQELDEIEEKVKDYKDYKLPPISLLEVMKEEEYDDSWVHEKVEILNHTLKQFRVNGKVDDYKIGPSVTRFEIALDMGVNVNAITKISDTIQMQLAAKDLRIEAPIPGKRAVGIEVANDIRQMVRFGNIAQSDEFFNSKPLNVGLGLDIDGDNVFIDIAKMPHGLVAGATGSGKSVSMNTILISLLLKNSPRDLRLMLVDPKMVELAPYNNIAHLVTPVITDAKLASEGLKWAVDEMERRYKLFAVNAARNIATYNAKTLKNEDLEHMPFIVIIVDELADLMMVASNDVEDSIMRITQKARACGIHLLVATQRPSTDVVKGTIKSNIPSRLAFSVATYTDSMTIIDRKGAEKLLGQGDMLISENGQPHKRVQGAYIDDDEIDKITEFIRGQMDVEYLFEQEELESRKMKEEVGDSLFMPVARFVVMNQSASINRIQKEFSIGFNRAQRLIELLENNNFVSGNMGSKARKVLITEEQLSNFFS